MGVIRRIVKRISCPHFIWHRVSSFEVGSFRRVIIECNLCGKRKIIDQLREFEILEYES